MNTWSFVTLIEQFYASWGTLLVFVSSFIEITPFGFAIPGALILATAGFFSFGTPSQLITIIVSGTFGTLLTFLLAYYMGMKTGNWLVKKLHQEKNAAYAKHLLEKHGGVILTTSLLSSVIRFWVAYVAGVQQYNIAKFFMYAVFASLTWVSLNTILGYIAGSERENLEKHIALTGILGWVLVGVSGLLITWSIRREFKEFKGDIDENN